MIWDRRLVGGALIVLLALAGARAAQAESDDRFRTGLPAAPAEDSAADAALTAALRALAGDSATSSRLTGADSAVLQGFYDRRGHRPLWVAAAGLAPPGRALLQTMERVQHQDAADFGTALTAAAARRDAAAPSALAELELLLSAALLANAVDPENLLAPGPHPQVLDEVADGAALADWLPPDPAFWRLRAAIETYRGHVEAGGWPGVTSGSKLEPGVRDGRVQQVRQRLLASGDLAVSGADPGLYDEALVEAVKRFQARHGLAPDGVIGHGTIDALNLSAESRLTSLIFNLQERHEQARDWGDDYVMVNIAAAQLELVQGGAVTAFYNVIVGRVERPTPELDSAIDRLEFNPYWTVPAGIYAKDILPKLRKDPGYIGHYKNLRVYRASEPANEVDPSSIDWFSPEAKQMRLRLRQDPGPENALGPAKFLFPNGYDVYLHGTNKPALFAKSNRFLSSGCVRLPDPLGFAELLLKQDPQWTRARIDKIIKGRKNQGVRLATPLPVHLVYDTAWVDETGTVQFRPDIYGRDQRDTEVAQRGGKGG